MSDQLAFGAMRAARALGLEVPGDLSVVGFDDVAAATTSDPPLTTVRQPPEARGRLAGTLILDLLHGRPVAAVTTFPVELVVRASTAPPGPERPTSTRPGRRGGTKSAATAADRNPEEKRDA
jgi:DNA-binding LacI/PurR family transcriptional regulator